MLHLSVPFPPSFRVHWSLCWSACTCACSLHSYEDAVALAQAADVIVLMLGIDGKCVPAGLAGAAWGTNVRTYCRCLPSLAFTCLHLPLLAHRLRGGRVPRPHVHRPARRPAWPGSRRCGGRWCWEANRRGACVRGDAADVLLPVCLVLPVCAPFFAVSSLCVACKRRLAVASWCGNGGCRNGGCLDVSAEKATVGAIVEAGYPGE